MADDVRQGEGAVGVVRRRGGCVVLSPPGSALLGVLLPALTRRWESMSVVSDEPAVMEHLAAGGVSMVVIVEPGAWGQLKGLAAAMGRYFGGVLCMRFEVEPGEHEPQIMPLASRWMGAGRAGASKVAEETLRGKAASLAGASPAAWAGSGGDDMLAARRASDAGGDGAAIGAELDVDEALLRPRRKVGALAVPVPAGASVDAGPPESLVTQEELSMLLGPGPGEVV